MARWTTLRKAQLERTFLNMRPAGTSGWRVAASLLVLRAQVDALWPRRSKVSDGTIGDENHMLTDSDHNPWVRDGLMGVVTAMDITHDPANGCDCERIAQALVLARDPRLKYIIWNRRILSATVAPWTWRPYKGRSPHTAHIHISVDSRKSLYDDKRPWMLEQD